MMMERNDIPGMQSTLKSFHCYVSTLMDCGLNKKKFTRSFYRDLPCTRISVQERAVQEKKTKLKGRCCYSYVFSPEWNSGQRLLRSALLLSNKILLLRLPSTVIIGKGGLQTLTPLCDALSRHLMGNFNCINRPRNVFTE